MELRQMRALQAVVMHGGIGQAAAALGLSQSSLSEQISKLESELAVRLLQRAPTGSVATPAGLAFLQRAQLALRHAEEAQSAAQAARLGGRVRVGLAPTTAGVLGLPLLQAIAQRYPDVRLHLVEGMASQLAAMLVARQLDMAVLFRPSALDAGSGNLRATPLLSERLYAMAARAHACRFGWRSDARLSWRQLADSPLLLPINPQGLRASINAAFARHGLAAQVAAEIDSLGTLMAAVEQGMGITVQPWAALARFAPAHERFMWREIREHSAQRESVLHALSDDELSPAALGVRLSLTDTVRQLVAQGAWLGAAPA